MAAPMIRVHARSAEGWIVIEINGRVYTYWADYAVIHRFVKLMDYRPWTPGKHFNYLKRAAVHWEKGNYYAKPRPGYRPQPEPVQALAVNRVSGKK